MSVEVEEEVTETAASESTVMVAVVKVKDEDGKLWKEAAEVISVSPTGAGFYMKRECKAGRLVSMMLPIEPELRFYDHDKELYRVWGLVQHCHRLTDDDIGFHVGVAFIGRHAPETYKADPMGSYRIVGMSEDGLWKVSEAAREFKPRKDTRYYTAVDHYLAVVDSKNVTARGERATTENISKQGAAVRTMLDLHTGDRVKFISEVHDFSGIAVVCNRQEASDGRALLNLQFVGSVFPVERISISAAKPVKEKVTA
ncbi:MAG: hypothetical protein AB7F88_11040 [Pyrinomonadaceae bacterium]